MSKVEEKAALLPEDSLGANRRYAGEKLHMTDEEWLARLCSQNNYSDGVLIGDGKYAAISRFLFTDGIIVGEVGDDYGYEQRWCYHKPLARAALKEWESRGFDNSGPIGWTRSI